MNDETGRTHDGARADGRVVLVGMMGSGKTTVGRLLAERSGWPYLDNDDLVRELSGREPSSVRAEDGEAALHDLESSALTQALAARPPVIVRGRRMGRRGPSGPCRPGQGRRRDLAPGTAGDAAGAHRVRCWSPHGGDR